MSLLSIANGLGDCRLLTCVAPDGHDEQRLIEKVMQYLIIATNSLLIQLIKRNT